MNKIEILNLKKSVKTEKTTKDILCNLTLTIPKGEIFCIMGSSGSGKSTLLKILGGMDSISEGEVIFFEKKMTSFDESDYERHRRDDIGYIFQDFNLLDGLTIKENIILPLTLQNCGPEIIEARYKNLLDFLDIKDFENSKPDKVSGGEQQRATIGRALIKSPKVILADEPTGSLDTRNMKSFIELVKNVNQRFYTTVVIVTHDTFVASNCDTVAFIEDGHIGEIIHKSDFQEDFHNKIIKIFTQVR